MGRLDISSASRLGRASSVVFATLITVGLFAAERRADIVVAILGIITLLILGHPARREGKGTFVLTATPRARSATIVALAPAVIGSAGLISFLGTSKLVPFLTSASNGVNALALMFSPVHSYVLMDREPVLHTRPRGTRRPDLHHFRDNHPYRSYFYGGRPFLSAEGGLTKTWLELGVVGVALYAGVFLSVLGPPLRSLRRIDGVGRAHRAHRRSGHRLPQRTCFARRSAGSPLFWLAAGGSGQEPR